MSLDIVSTCLFSRINETKILILGLFDFLLNNCYGTFQVWWEETQQLEKPSEKALQEPR